MRGRRSRWTKPTEWGEGQRVADLGQHVDRALDIEAALPRQRVIERLALEQLHRQVQPIVRGAAEVVDLDDVLVVELGDRGRLAPEPLDREVVARQLVVEDLDRDLAPERDVLGAIDGPGSALPDDVEDLEAVAEELADQRIASISPCISSLRRSAVRAEQRRLHVRVLATGAGQRGHLMGGHGLL